MEVEYPYFIHGEVMSHRAFSRNAASARAIPVKKMLKRVWSDPAMPVWWGENQPGMQAQKELKGWRLKVARSAWKWAGRGAVAVAWVFDKVGLHKQIANRVLAPWMWMNTIITATDWANFFHLRLAEDAQPEMKALAEAMYKAYRNSTPRHLQTGQWHLPYIGFSELLVDEEEVGTRPWLEVAKKCSVARCARVSYLTHDGQSPDVSKDVSLHDRLIKAPHSSPFEHQATPMPGRHANFKGWRQYRHYVPNENVKSYPGID